MSESEPEFPIDPDLENSVVAGQLNVWQAMQVQTCRSVVAVQDAVSELQKKMDELGHPPPPPLKMAVRHGRDGS